MTTTAPPVTFGTRRYSEGPHDHVRIWAGTNEHSRGLAGELIMRPAEAEALERRLTGPDLSTEDLERLCDALFLQGRRTTSDSVRTATTELQERLAAAIDARTEAAAQARR